MVNYNGGARTLQCLDALLRSHWPRDRLEVVLVDNASTDGIADRVEADFPSVRVIRSEHNIGYGAASNLALRDGAGIECFALVNPDARVTSDWLEPLALALASDPSLGAACPKIVLSGHYVPVRLTPLNDPHRRHSRDPGVVRVSAVQVDGHDVTDQLRLAAGVAARSSQGHWMSEKALLQVPVGAEAGRTTAALRLEARTPTTFSLRSGPAEIHHEVTDTPNWYECPLSGTPAILVNNAGTSLVQDGYAADRGWLEVDDGRFDTASDVFAWCGAAALLRADYLEDVGLFDERLFLYYEDVELAWRGRASGWRYRLAPDAVVAHDHSTSTIEGSVLFDHLNERNHLLVVTRHGSLRLVCRAWIRHLLVTMSYARRAVVMNWRHGPSGDGVIVRRRLRAFVAALRGAPRMLRSRAEDAHRPSRRRD